VVGLTGSGKTTLAGQLASRMDVPHVELDALFWEPGWVEAYPHVFRARIAEATSGHGWVTCGNYWSKAAHDILWPRADTIVWLDLPLRVALRRVTVRTVRRGLTGVELWSGNREHLGGLWAKDSLLRWAVANHSRLRDRYLASVDDPLWSHLEFVRLRTPGAVRRWLRDVHR
jgi:adenylate kinase family enzyme